MIELTNINKSFRNLHIFDNLNMTFNDKQLTVLLGENGAVNQHYSNLSPR